MHKSLNDNEATEICKWAESFRPTVRRIRVQSPNDVIGEFKSDLIRYFGLCGIARRTARKSPKSEQAIGLLFPTRVNLEKAIHQTLRASLSWDDALHLARFTIFGFSKKQGVSIRFPLSTCVPTRICGGACYAHDALDATPGSLVRGAINGWVATIWEECRDKRDIVDEAMTRHLGIAVRAALREQRHAASEGHQRPAYIRFSHVGDMAERAAFSNNLARRIVGLSEGAVRCVIYTRHPKAGLLDPTLFIINFALDSDSLERRMYAPKESRLVFSAFEGKLERSVAINFVEHHRWQRSSPVGDGHICPVTAPQTAAHSCDAARCSLCFHRPQ